MTVKLLIFLIIGTIAMSIPLLMLANRYGISRWKVILLTIMLTIAGTAGTFLMYYIENRGLGLSFYGAVFLVPLGFLIVAPILRIPYNKAMDLCAIGECIMLALMKVHCIMGGCCIGRALFEISDGTVIRFPSRLAEMSVAIVLFVILFRFAKKGENCGGLYPWYLLLYGGTRFGLNILREAWVEKTMFLPFGNIWSLCAVVIGGMWLVKNSKKNTACSCGDKE